ncbi:MAG: ABC transporter ATP-binding protein [Elusimicrobiota bacterium]
MSETVIKVEGLSKRYRIGAREGYRTFRETLVEAAQAPFRRLAALGRPVPEEETVWALKDVSFEVKQGEALGIIGRNGAGKSTLLKILSRITEPTSGRAELRGRVGSLLEVGTGFHPELSGRENVYLYGAILGMSSIEISRKFDGIMSFAGIERFIDTPVKRYSSGMYMRLAFSVAAHLEPEILIVDEVLAVGDAQFQKKCMGKMEAVGKEGRTVLFVSHNLTAMKNLCDNGILLEEGAVKFAGGMGECVDCYLADASARAVVNNQWDFDKAPGTDKIKVKSACVRYPGDRLTVKTPFDIVTEFWNLEEGLPVNVSMHLHDISGNLVFNIATQNIPLKKGLHRTVFHIPGELLNDGYYTVQNYFVTAARVCFNHNNANSFEVAENREISEWHGKWLGAVRPTFIKNEYYLIEGL